VHESLLLFFFSFLFVIEKTKVTTVFGLLIVLLVSWRKRKRNQ
jgi:hypothetical protein